MTSFYRETIYSVAISTATMLGKKYIPPQGTTLNEKFSIRHINSTNGIMTTKYYMLGMSLRNNGNAAIVQNKHSAIDACVYNPMPLYVRKTGEIIPDNISNKYRLKTTIVKNDISYTVYYGGLITNVNAEETIKKITSVNNITPLELSNHNVLSPVPIDPSITPSTVRVGYSDPITIALTNEELNEIKNAMNILPGEESTDVEYKEINNATLSHFIGVDFIVDGINTSLFRRTIELGGMFPLGL